MANALSADVAQQSTFWEAIEALRQIGSSDEPIPDRLALGQIKIVPQAFQPRELDQVWRGTDFDPSTVRELVRALKAKPRGKRYLDPILVYRVGGDVVCVDGHHRWFAYREAGYGDDYDVPVERLVGGLEDAIACGIASNSKDKLTMTRSEKLDGAWRLVMLGKHSKAQIAEIAAVSDGTVAEMRRAFKSLTEQGEQYTYSRWADVKKALNGDDKEWSPDDIEEMIMRIAEDYERRLVKTFGGNLHQNYKAFAMALENLHPDLPKRLVEHWNDIALDMIDTMKEADEGLDDF